jgi:hypothetical protein
MGSDPYQYKRNPANGWFVAAPAHKDTGRNALALRPVAVSGFAES